MDMNDDIMPTPDWNLIDNDKGSDDTDSSDFSEQCMRTPYGFCDDETDTNEEMKNRQIPNSCKTAIQCLCEKINHSSSQEKSKYTRVLAGSISYMFSIVYKCTRLDVTYVCFVFCLFSPATGDSTSVRWQFESPTVFGGCMILKIHIPTELARLGNGTLTWHGGPNNTILSFENVSSDLSKYETKNIFNQNESVHILIIKKFSARDLNSDYICQSGFNQYLTALTLNDSIFERRPTANTIENDLHIEGNDFNGYIVFNAVYPSPNCSFSFDTTPIDNSKIVRRETNISIANLKVIFVFNFTVGYQHHCGNFAMYCSIATFITSKTFIVKNCTDNTKEVKQGIDFKIAIGCLCGAMMFTCLVILIIYKKRNKREKLKPPQQEDAKEKEEPLLSDARHFRKKEI